METSSSNLGECSECILKKTRWSVSKKYLSDMEKARIFLQHIKILNAMDFGIPQKNEKKSILLLVN